MINYKRTKKKLIISYKNLSDDLKLVFKDTYPDGHKEYIQKITKPDGEPLFVVPMETEDTSYLIRVDMKIDTLQAKDLEKEMFDTEDKVMDDSEFAPMSEALDKDDDLSNNHTERVLNHGSYEGIMDEMTSEGGKRKKSLSERDEILNEMKEDFGDDDDDEEEYKDSYTDDDVDEDDDLEPSADDLAELEEELLEDINPSKKAAKGGRKKTTVKVAPKTTAKKTTAKTATKTTAKAATKTAAKTTVRRTAASKKK